MAERLIERSNHNRKVRPLAQGVPEVADMAVRDPVYWYLREAARAPLLERNQEIAEFQLVRSGIRAKQLIQYRPRMKRLQHAVVKGEAARERIARSNLRLVVSVAKHYIGRGLPLLDLIQEGNIGLIKAIDRFKLEKGNKFDTYATWWIKKEIKYALYHEPGSYGTRIPIHARQQLDIVFSLRAKFVDFFGREPSTEEWLDEIRDYGKKYLASGKVKEDNSFYISLSRFSKKQLDRMEKATVVSVPMDSLITKNNQSESDNRIGDFVEDPQSAAVMERVCGLRPEEIEKLFEESGLDPREKNVLVLRFGLGDLQGDRRSLDEVKHEFGISRERVRQIENKAMNKIRLGAEKFR